MTMFAETFAAHVGRSEVTIAKWCGVHTRLFRRLRAGEGCRVDTYNKALRSIAERWPSDLEWPRAVPRPETRAETRSLTRRGGA